MNRYGEIDDNIAFDFAPLWEMDERERAEINKINADTVAVYVDRGVLSQEEVREALADNPDSGYSNIDADDVPENDNFADVDMDDKDEAGSVFDEAMDGGNGSGNFNHAGRLGKVGGSAENGVESSGKHITEISGNEVDEAGGFIAYYDKYLKGKTVDSPVLGEIHFYGRQADETKSKNRKTPENLKYIAGVYELLKTSRDSTPEEPNHERKDDIKIFHRVKGWMSANGEKPREVIVKVAEDIHGKKYYTLDARTEEQKNPLLQTPSLRTGSQREFILII